MTLSHAPSCSCKSNKKRKENKKKRKRNINNNLAVLPTHNNFTKYQNCICWDERVLCKVVKDAIPNQIRDELRYSQEDMSSFEGFKRVVLWIDNDYWKRI